ncbi:hypothetical protein C0Q70_12598 [Pomacea canaliculata]|uniref:Uncharacterized protein n=1 Tax=Pomacea canaliculata TaxID=400727 RepID=A0A2T7P1Z1_POMCA|nr:hypothetical protein C0Q70_12598 [Pomacea canaliculata]
MAANIEVLLDMCLGSCLKPGIVNLDLHALKRFLHDLSHGVQDLQKTNVQRIVDDLTLKFHKMVSDLEKVQSQIKEVQKDSNNIEELTRDVESIKMDLVDLAGCSRLTNSTLHKFREQLFDSPSKNTGTTDYLENVVVELVKRVENIEHRKGQRKSRGFTKHLLQAESKGVPGKGKKEKRTRHSLGFNDEKSSDEKVETPQCDPADGVELGPSSSSGTVALATAFREFTTLLNQTRLVKPPAVVKFLLLMKGSDEITPEMIKELMTVLSTSLVTKLITTMENSDGLTIEAIVTIVDMVQTLPFMHRALCTLLGAIQGDSSIPAAALLEIFEVLRSATSWSPSTWQRCW